MTSQTIFIAFVILLAIQRLFELRLSRRNEAQILAQGGREHAPEHFGLMKAIHTLWFFSMIVEVLNLDRPFIPGLAAGAFIMFLTGQALRYAAIRTLGPRWTVRIMTLPNAPPIQDGIYRLTRHPNYLGVALEIAAVPLLHTAYITAVFFTLFNVGILAIRIRAEEAAVYGNPNSVIPKTDS